MKLDQEEGKGPPASHKANRSRIRWHPSGLPDHGEAVMAESIPLDGIEEVGPQTDASLSDHAMEQIRVDAIFDPRRSKHLITASLFSKQSVLKNIAVRNCEDPSVYACDITLYS
jgi:hypothetical protein